MKNRIKIIGIALIFASAFSSCKKDDVAPADTNTTSSSSTSSSTPVQASARSITAGEWKISSFVINGIDHSDMYAGYAFRFNTDGSVNAIGTEPVNGSWSINQIADNLFYRLNFGNAYPLLIMNQDQWTVVTQNDALLEMNAKRGDDGIESISFAKK